MNGLCRAGKRVIEYMEWGGREGWEKGTVEIGVCMAMGKGVGVVTPFSAVWGGKFITEIMYVLRDARAKRKRKYWHK